MFARARSTTRTPCRTDKPRFLGPERMAAPRSPSRALSVRACRSLSGALHTMARRARVGLPCDLLPVPFINAERISITVSQEISFTRAFGHMLLPAPAPLAGGAAVGTWPREVFRFIARVTQGRTRRRAGGGGPAGARPRAGPTARVQKKLRVFSSSPNNLSIAPPTHSGGTTANLKAPPGEPSSGLPRRVAHRPGGESVRSR